MIYPNYPGRNHRAHSIRHFAVNLFFIVLAGVPSLLFAQSIAVVSPEKCGLIPERVKSLERMLQGYADRKQVAGGVVLIARKGEVGYFHSFGMSNLEKKQPMSNDAIFRIASMTKAVSIVATMTLYEDGFFSLDDPISKFIPEFAQMQVMVLDTPKATYHLEKARRPITIRHLLNHTSGITYDLFGQKYINDMYTANHIYNGIGKTTGTVKEMVGRLTKLPLVFHPGEGWQYGLNMDVLGYLVEIVSGKTLDQYMKDRIFTPLGMTDTHFFLPEEKVGRLATLYAANQQGTVTEVKGETKLATAPYADYATVATNKSYFAGGGGLLSTVSDYFKFAQMLLNGGTYNNKRILSRKTVELMSSEQTGNMFNWQPGYGFGFGFAISRGPSQTGNPGSAGEYNWSGFFDTHFWIDPKEQLIGIIMIQGHPRMTDIGDKFKNLTYMAIGE